MLLWMFVLQFVLSSNKKIRKKADEVYKNTASEKEKMCKEIISAETDRILGIINADDDSVLINKKQLEDLKMKVRNNEGIKDKHEKEKKILLERIKELENNDKVVHKDSSVGEEASLSLFKQIFIFICVLILLSFLFVIHYLLIIYSGEFIAKYV